MEEKPDALDIITSCQRSLAPLRKYEDNIVHHLNRINTKSSSDCSTFRNHLEDLWQSRKLILDEAFLRMEDREKKLEESEIEQKDLHFIYKTV